MTREEAITRLKYYKERVLPITLEETVDMTIEALEKDCSECTRRKFYQQGYQDGLNANKWIPCSEKPEKEDVYLVAWLPAYKNEKGDTITLPCPYTHFYMLAEYYDDEEEWGYKLPNGYDEAVLLAYQPLPEPYKEVGGMNE